MINRILDNVEKPYLKQEPPKFEVGDTVDVHTRIVNNEGVERIFPLHSPFIAKVVVRRGGETRRAKLFYLRNRVGKAVRLTEKRKSKRDEAQEGTASSDEPKRAGAREMVA